MSGIEYKFNAAFNNVIHKYQRKDFIISSVADGGADSIICYHNSGNIAVTGTVYANLGTYVGKYSVLEYGNNYIKLDTPYIGAGNGFINSDVLKENFYVDVKLLDGTTFLGSYKAKADYTGEVLINVKSVITSLINLDVPNDHSDLVFTDLETSGRYSLYYKEMYVGSNDSYSNNGEYYYYVNAAKQYGDDYGQNMADYEPSRLQYGKFLTPFNELMYFDGYPFNLSFINSPNLGTNNIDKYEDRIYNDTVDNQNVNEVSDSGQGYTQQLEMVRYGNLDVDYINVYLRMNDINPIYVAYDYVDNDYVE